MDNFNIKKLCKPISKEAPTGRDLRTDHAANSLYYQIKDARTRARQAERKMFEEHKSKTIIKEWQTVYTLAITILTEHSKDLEISAWLIEALLRIDHLRGLAVGFKLTAELIKLYWPSLYPFSDDEGMGRKIAALAGLNGDEVEGTLIIPILSCPVTEGITAGPYALWQYKQALEVHRIPDQKLRERRLLNGAITMEKFSLARRETPAHFYQSLQNDLNACRQSFSTLNALLDEKCAKEAPPYSNIRKALDTFAEYLKFLLADASINSQEAIVTENKSSAQFLEKPNSHNEINREQALQSLAKIGQFFTETEPHSPLPFLLQRAIDWGHLPLPELLQELIEDDTTRGHVFKLTGIKMK